MNSPIYYLHIPKTGGSSFTSFLDSQFDPEEICPAQLLPELFQVPLAEMSRYKLFRGHLWHGLNTYVNQSLIYLTMLRDPVQRTISWYSHVKRDENAYRHHRVINENWSLLDFVTDSETNWDMINAQTLFLSVDLDYAKLSGDPVGYGRSIVRAHAKRPDDRELLNIAKKRLEECAFFGITERMQDSKHLLSYVMNFYPNFSVPRLNISSNRPSDHEISAETIRAINEITRLDQELYNWACQVFEDRFGEMTKSLLVSHFKSKNPDTSIPWHSPLPAEERKLFDIKITEAPPKIDAASTFQVTVAATNNSKFSISGQLSNPINASYHWIDASTGVVVVFDGERTK
ncbi:sulfotransferase family 2 domain-containing protein, partial [Pseudomonas sp.]|uniref:sulfotransferase family 2 domain-containing protein n=1 Tax=Pseudomonas sp. TaxID=306 RepID=UPI002608CEF5